MNGELRLLLAVFILVSSVFPLSVSRGILITFDDVSAASPPGTLLQNGYQGFVWSNFWVLNAVPFGTSSGYHNGLISNSNVAYNAFGNPSGISAIGGNFNLVSAYLTAAYTSNLSVQVQGFRGQSLVYGQTAVVTWTGPSLVMLNFQNIDHVEFDSFGGLDAGIGGSLDNNQQFVMDDLNVEPVPEPSVILLVGIGTLVLLRRRLSRSLHGERPSDF
jgi:PEP-CTERM motif-containing protein